MDTQNKQEVDYQFKEEETANWKGVVHAAKQVQIPHSHSSGASSRFWW